MSHEIAQRSYQYRGFTIKIVATKGGEFQGIISGKDFGSGEEIDGYYRTADKAFTEARDTVDAVLEKSNWK